MPSSTFKGLYQECNECVYQCYDNIKNKNNCSFSHKKIRSNANSTGIKYERDFRWCGLKQKKRNNNKINSYQLYYDSKLRQPIHIRMRYSNTKRYRRTTSTISQQFRYII